MNKRKSYKHYQEQLNNTKTCFLSQNLQNQQTYLFSQDLHFMVLTN